MNSTSSKNPFQPPATVGGSTRGLPNVAGRRSLYIALIAFVLVFAIFAVYLYMFVLSSFSPAAVLIGSMVAIGVVSGIGALSGFAVALYPEENKKIRFTGSLVFGLMLNTLLALLAGCIAFFFRSALFY